MMVHRATGYVDVAIAHAPTTTYYVFVHFSMSVSVCCTVSFSSLPVGRQQSPVPIMGLRSTGPLIDEADMMAYTTAISQNSIACIVPPAMPRHHVKYVHLPWLSELVVRALDAAKCRFLELHRCGNFQNMSASVSIDKLFLAMLDESISHLDTSD